MFGVRSTKIYEKLINDGSDLTLQKCTDIARTYEMSETQVKVMTANQDKKSIDVVKRKPPPTQPGDSYSGTGRLASSHFNPGKAIVQQGLHTIKCQEITK